MTLQQKLEAHRAELEAALARATDPSVQRAIRQSIADLTAVLEAA